MSAPNRSVGRSPRPGPPRTAIVGRFATVELLDPDRHAAELFDANSEDREGRLWNYYNFGPFATLPEYRAWLDAACANPDRLYHAIRDNAQGQAVGIAVRRVIALYEPTEGETQARSESEPAPVPAPAFQTPELSPVNGHLSLAAAIREGAAVYLRSKDGRATGGEIYQALVARGVEISGSRPISVVSSRLSRSPLFDSGPGGYGLVR